MESDVAQAAARIRKALKAELGLTSRQVSVRSERYSMGSSIDVYIKEPLVSKEKVQEIADRERKVRYCEASGEVLSGGNRFVDVQYSLDHLFEEVGQKIPLPDGQSVKKVVVAGYEVTRPNAKDFIFYNPKNGDQRRVWHTAAHKVAGEFVVMAEIAKREAAA